MGRRRYARLGTWSSPLPAPFPVQGGTHRPHHQRPRRAAYGALTRSGRPFQAVPLRRTSGDLPHAGPRGGTTPPRLRACARWAARVWAAAGSARRYSRPRACFFLLGLLRCFTSPACPHPPSGGGDRPRQPAGFPHSGTVGSPPARGLPHALGPSRPPFLGLRRPGHPPGALSNAGRVRRALRSIDMFISRRRLLGHRRSPVGLTLSSAVNRAHKKTARSAGRLLPVATGLYGTSPIDNRHQTNTAAIIAGSCVVWRPQQKSDGKTARQRAPIDLRMPPRPLPRAGEPKRWSP